MINTDPDWSGDGCRLHFWFDGAPEDRPGGPWWSRAFYATRFTSAAQERADFYNTARHFLRAAAISGEAKPTWGERLSDDPPEGAIMLDPSKSWNSQAKR